MGIGVNEGISSVAFDVLIDYPALSVEMPEADNGGMEWPERPWGCIHWDNVRWQGASTPEPTTIG